MHDNTLLKLRLHYQCSSQITNCANLPLNLNVNAPPFSFYYIILEIKNIIN